MSKKSCRLWPYDAKGNKSVLWTQLDAELKKENRGITNLMYVLSKSEAFKEKMAKLGKTPDSTTGEFDYDTVWEQLKGSARVASLGTTDTKLKELGEIDKVSGKRVIHTYDDAARKARKINDNNKYNDLYVAYVQGNNGQYWVTLEVKTSSNQIKAGILKR